MIEEKLIPMSVATELSTQGLDMDSVASSKAGQETYRRCFDVLMEAQRYWSNMDGFRKRADRCKRYTYGDQWGDKIRVDGKWITEEQYILSQGNIPLKNNLIRRLVKNVLGVYRSQSKEPTCVARDKDENKLGQTMSTILQCNMQLNRAQGLNARALEDFLISGLCVQKKWFGRNQQLGKTDCWTKNVSRNNIFIDNNMRDPRGWDCSMIGEIHDWTFNDLVGNFAHSPADYEYLRRIYATAHDRNMIADNLDRFGESSLRDFDFFCSSNNPTLCRVIEVWRKERKPRYECRDYNTGELYKIEIEDYDVLVRQVNERRILRAQAAGMPISEVPLIKAKWYMDEYWYYYFLTPFGHVLDEGETPYEHQSHPYVFKAYPFINGEIYSFVSDVIDQQRYINRLITLQDWVVRATAKGVLLFPEEALPDGYSLDDIADQWARYNGMIVCKTKGGVQLPQQIVSNATNIGIQDILQLELQIMEDASGVNGALQGKQGYAGTSGTLYAQQTQNATMSLLDILDTFSEFVQDGAIKDVKNIQQFYDTQRTFNIAGKNAVVNYDPDKIRDVEFDLSIIESTATPAYRQMANDFLMQLFNAQAISIEQLLETGDFPFGEELLQNIKTQQEQMQQGQMPSGVAPGQVKEVQQQLLADNPNVVENAKMIQQALNEGEVPFQYGQRVA